MAKQKKGKFISALYFSFENMFSLSVGSNLPGTIRPSIVRAQEAMQQKSRVELFYICKIP